MASAFAFALALMMHERTLIPEPPEDPRVQVWKEPYTVGEWLQRVHPAATPPPQLLPWNC